MVLRRPLAPLRRLTLSRLEARPVGLVADRVSSFLLHRNAVRPEELDAGAVTHTEQPALEDARGREQLRLDWEQHDRERD